MNMSNKTRIVAIILVVVMVLSLLSSMILPFI